MNRTPDDLSRFRPAGLRRQISVNRPPMVPIYRVGEQFHPKYRNWPDTVEYSFGPSGHELTLFRPDITQELIDDVGKGPAEFALIVEWPIIVLAYRFGESSLWGDAPYCWHLQPAARQVIPTWKPERELRSLLWVTLVGCDDGIIHAQRGLTLSPAFTNSLHEAIRSQAMRGFDPNQCAMAVSSVFADRSSIEARLDQVSARTAGNA